MSRTNTTRLGSWTSAAVRRREAKRSWWVPYATHGVLILLASMIWYMSYRSVETTETIERSATLELVLPEELRDQWVVVAEPTERPTLRVRGPKERIDLVRARLRSQPRGGVFQFTVTPEWIGEEVNGTKIEREVSLDQFGDVSNILVPGEAELTFETPAQVVRYTLEAVHSRRVTLTADAIKLPESYEPTLRLFSELWVRGPASKVEPLLIPGETQARLQLEPWDLASEIARELELVPREQREQVVTKARRVSRPLVRPDGVEILLGESGTVLRRPEADIEIALESRAQYMEKQVILPISYLLPTWMIDRKVEWDTDDEFNTLPLRLLVTAQQEANFNERNVKLICDLTHLRESDGLTEGNPDPETGFVNRRIVKREYPVRMEVKDRASLDYRFTDEMISRNRTEQEVYRVKVGLVWKVASSGER